MVQPSRKFDPKHSEISVFGALLRARGEFGGRRVALHDADDRKLTYDEILRAAFALGAALKRGTQRGEAVGLMLPTGIGVVVSFFALSAYGRLPAMLNFTAGASSLKAAFRLAKIRKVVTARAFIEIGGLHDLIAEIGSEVEFIYLEDVRAKLGANEKAAALAGMVAPWAVRAKQVPSSPAVILFTSGTEGDPKGVLLSHTNLVSNVFQILAHVPEALTPSDVLFNPLPTFHSFGLTAGMLLPLLGGMKSALHPSPLQTKVIPKRILETGATLAFATDTFLSQWVRASSGEEFSKLRFIVCGAERVKDETRQLVAQKAGVTILEGYGVTEASPVIAVNQPRDNRYGTVGKPLPGIDVRFEQVPGIDAGGRLFIRGPNIMTGYLDTRQPGKIVRPENDWHDTGDVVVQDEAGFLAIRGRLKRFAKIGGEMVSLAVVENCASATWRDHDHAAAVLPDTRKGEQIVLLTTRPHADRTELVRWAQAHGTSELALPRKIYFVDRIPVLASGKMDIGTVQKMAVELSAAQEALDPSRSAPQ